MITIIASNGFEAILVPALLGIATIVLLFVGYRAYYKKRLIEDVPTSKCQGVTIGLNELKGKAITHSPIIGYLSGQPCVYYTYKIEEEYKRTVTRDGKKRTERRWRTIASETRFRPFELHDDTGSIRVNPKGAEFHGDVVVNKTCRRTDPMYYGKGPMRSLRRSTGRRRFREEIIPNQCKAYVMGDARVREDIVEPEIAHDEMGDLFLISSQSEGKLISKFGWQARGSFAGSILAAAFLPAVITMNTQQIEFGAAVGASIVWMVLAAVMVSMVVFLLYLKTVFNGLVDVRNRLDRAWSMLEVEFKRRHDLIPNLVQMVKGFASHEKDTLEAVVQARNQGAISPGQAAEAGAAINQQSSALGQIYAVAEDYPDIKADPAFRKLMEELTRCEDKIALARAFYNDSVERLNNRVHAFPDMMLAPLAGTKERTSLAFDAFIKKPVKIDLTPDPSADEEVVAESEQIDESELTEEEPA